MDIVQTLSKVTDIYKTEVTADNLPFYKFKVIQALNEIKALENKLSAQTSENVAFRITIQQNLAALALEKERLEELLNKINQMQLITNQTKSISYISDINKFIKNLKEASLE